ncbi:unnamed protein product [Polarella glacialis]|uniref:Uncharacterized protein n=2 Tax=Polarella glacialis TaxID=89957 RepID=A0A813HIL8_POLGL|nr:unnamed protein product [Polarella glacialis]
MRVAHASSVLLVALLAVPLVAADERCVLPFAMRESLRIYEQTDIATGLKMLVSGCFSSLHDLWEEGCESLFRLPEVANVRRTSESPSGWQNVIVSWAEGQGRELKGWAAKKPQCVAKELQLRLSPKFLDDCAEHLAVLAARQAGGIGAASAWIYRFQSAWSMILYYATLLQLASLSGFDITTELAFDLHGHRPLEHGISGKDSWAAVANSLPIFRLPRARPLHHQALAAEAVVDEIRRYVAPGRRLALAEVGVFRANLSAHVWRRVARARGSFELHLVDHWGDAGLAASSAALGTGSDMGGASDTSLLKSVGRRFSEEAGSCVELPYGQPGGASLTRNALEGRGDVFFHRTSSVGAASSFADGALDVVYIDADHKWWSVVSDIAAWWPKVRPGGTMMGHDFHLNALMEREDQPGGDTNDVPMAVIAFFRFPLEVVLHSGFVWSVRKPLDADVRSVGSGISGGEVIDFDRLCEILRRKMAPHREFEVCESA